MGATMKFLILALLLTGCSAELVERLSTDIYMGQNNATEPSLYEMKLLSPEPKMGVDERLYINNPLPYGINVYIECNSIYQVDQVVHVKARATRYILVTRPKQKYGPSCFIVSYSLEKI